ncbi:MAG TPA: hypothetical protein VLG50_06460 [Candidatus Saccharimonadales bacterium]|nr:hypothetical protein [Candidatus Saccharimonadales bacterium]
MDTILSFPRKNPKYCNMSELKKMCIYFSINVSTCTKKSEFITLLTPYYKKFDFDVFPQTVQIQVQNKYYYVPVSHFLYKQLDKTYDDVYREVYKLTGYNGRFSRIVKYSKKSKQWNCYTNYKVQEDREVNMNLFDITRLRNVIVYLEFYHIYMMCLYLLHHNHMIMDVFNYLVLCYKQYTDLPPIVYSII